MTLYYAKATTVGRNKIAAFGTGGPIITIAQMAVGDSNGVYYDPTGEEAALVHEVWRGDVNRVYVHPNNANWIVVEVIIPATVGGWDIREAGVYDSTGAFVGIAKYPLTNKPAPGSGSEKDIYARIIIQVADAAAVAQTIDPSLVFATQEYVDARMPRPVRVATTANIALAGLQTIDTIELAVNDRVLVRSQAATADNGIYLVKAGVWLRATDADNALEVVAGMMVIVAEGAAHADTVWLLTTDAPIVVGTTGLIFTKIFPDEASRTISDATAPTGDTGTPTTLFGWLANRIKAITGKASWRTAPAITLEGASVHVAAEAPHSGHLNHSLATAENDVIVASGAGVFVKKTLAQFLAILGFSISIGPNGHIRFPLGFIVQWGQLTNNPGNSGWATVYYPVAFPSNVTAITGSHIGGGGAVLFINASYVNNTYFVGNVSSAMNSPTVTALSAYWIAIGY